MKTVHEVSKLTGVSIRTLQYYDSIGLLPPAEYTESGYRLYDDATLERLQQILLFRELQFPLKEIKEILASPSFDREKALTQQIELLTLKKERLEELISFAREVKARGGKHMSFKAFDKKKIEEYTRKAKEQWGNTPQYQEYEEKAKGKTDGDTAREADEFMQIFAEFGAMKAVDPASEAAQTQVKKLQDYISSHYYKCTVQILAGLGQMYAAGGEFTENIDAAGGEGTANFAAQAISIYCK